MTREAALHRLLMSLFNADELRDHLFLQRDGAEVLAALPGPLASHASVTSAAIQALRARGLLDRDFFDALDAVRPKRGGEIRRVRNTWLHSGKLDRGERWAEGRYELQSLLGTGGFGLVWKAIDTRTGAFVALKILLEHHAEDLRIRQRFCRGAAVLADLSHPGIVRVHSGVEQEGSRFYYVMEYINGESLDALANKRSRPELLGYTLQVGTALAHIHECDLLHRDVKPNNIIVTAKGQAKLIDFDLVTGDSFAPMTTRHLGTALYSPPEANLSHPKTAAYDVFSLARTVEYVLRGRDPTMDELVAPDPLASLDATARVKDVLRAALAATPAARTRSIAEFCAALRKALKPAPPAPLARKRPVPPREAQASAPPPATGLVTCTRCATEFSIDVTLVDSQGVTARCSVCGHLFWLEPRPPGARLWRLSKAAERSLTMNPMSALFASIQAGELRPLDKLSGTGERWLALGDIPEFSPQFLGQGKRDLGVFHVLEPIERQREAADQRWGTMLNQRFRVEDLLSFEGLRPLYRGRDTEEGKPCLLRLVPRAYAGLDVFLDLRLRLRALERLRHRNIIKHYYVDRLAHEDEVLIVMDILDGTELRTAITAERWLSPARAIAIADEICSALSAAHAVGVVHGDLRTTSISLVHDERGPDSVRIMDTGVFIASDPEFDEPASPDADVFALGAILFEMLTGAPYLPHLLPELRRRTAPALAGLVASCLAPSRDRRPNSMVAVGQALRALGASRSH